MYEPIQYLYQIFSTTEMLFFKLEEKYWVNLKTYLVFLNRLPLEEVYSRTLLPKKIITDIPLNDELIKILRNI